MAGHTRRLLGSIERACEQYSLGDTPIAELQLAVEPVVAAIEADAKPFESVLRRFLAQLEYIRFMSDGSEQRAEVEREIALLRSEISELQRLNDPK